MALCGSGRSAIKLLIIYKDMCFLELKLLLINYKKFGPYLCNYEDLLKGLDLLEDVGKKIEDIVGRRSPNSYFILYSLGNSM